MDRSGGVKQGFRVTVRRALEAAGIRWNAERLIPSTASVTRLSLALRGIDPDAIGPGHLAKVYASMRPHRHGSNRRDPESLLPAEGVTPDEETPVWGLILETRNHPQLVPVITAAIERLGLPVQALHGPENAEFIRSSSLAPHIESGRLRLTELAHGKVNGPNYNGLFLSPEFWERVIGRKKILVFQTDALFCEGARYGLNDFLHCDYIGSRWARPRPSGLILDGGNGGLSLRDWARTVECLKRFPPAEWPVGEDDYFAFHLDVMGARVGQPGECNRFGTQHTFACKSFGAHDIRCLAPRDLARFLAYCPEGRSLLETSAGGVPVSPPRTGWPGRLEPPQGVQSARGKANS